MRFENIERWQCDYGSSTGSLDTSYETATLSDPFRLLIGFLPRGVEFSSRFAVHPADD